MDAAEPHEPFCREADAESITAIPPHARLRYDSHGMSPRHHATTTASHDQPEHFALRQSASEKLHCYGLRPTHTNLVYRAHNPQVFHDSDGFSSPSPESPSSDETATGRERQQNDGETAAPVSGGDAAGEEDVEEITATTIPRSSVVSIDRPFGNLLVDTHGADVQDIGQWYFASQMPAIDLQFFRAAELHWVRGIWEMARVSQPIYAAIASFALHKKAVLSGKEGQVQYYEQKGRMIQDIFANINKTQDGSPDPLTVVAIAMLAYLDIRDAQLESAGTHLAAVRKFIDMPRLPTHAWLYCVWIDLRYSLFTGQEPQLPFYIPTAYRELPTSVLSCQPEASRLGSVNALECPRSSLFTLDMARDIFRKLHALCYCSDTLVSAEVPPFGQIYALEYGLRVVQSRAAKSEGDQFIAHIVVLLTSAIQLHVWLASRFWTPQRQESHYALIMRACTVIESFDDMVSQWYISAGLESLLWVLFTFVATLRAHELSHAAPMLELLHRAVRKADITHCEQLERRLEKWPWLKNWHPVQIRGVWAMLCARYPDYVPAGSMREGEQLALERDPSKARSRWFIGGLEFFNSL